MFRLAHISDLHFFDSVNVPVRKLLNKRITGYANFLLHRRFQHSMKLLGLLLESIKEQNVDHLVVTGDLTNLSLGSEFAGVRELFLHAGFSASDISTVPGNHDRYTKGSELCMRFEGYLSPFMQNDIDSWNHNYPFVRLRREVAVIGINSAKSLPPLFAGGEIGIEQLTRLEVILQHSEVRDRFPVFIVHHPPYRHPRKQVHMLEGLRDYRKLIEAIHVPSALFLHGHLHKNIYRKLEVDGKSFLVSGVSSSSYKYKGRSSAAVSSFVLYDIDKTGVRSVKCFKYNRSSEAYEPGNVSEEIFVPVNL